MILERQQLVNVLQEAKRVKGRSSIEVLRCALVDVQGPEARLDVTDMETYASIGMKPRASNSWIKGLIDVERALGIVKSLNYREVWLFQSEEGHILISNAIRGSKAPVQLLGGIEPTVEDWPKRPELQGEVEAAFSILPDDLRTAWEAVHRAISKDESRPALASLHVAVNGDVSFHGCDSYRLHLMEADGQALMDGDMLIPRRAMDAVVKHTKGRTTPVLFERAGERIRVAFGKGDDQWMVRACMSQYPNVGQLVPEASNLPLSAVVDRMSLLASVKQAEALLRAKTDPVVVSVTDEHVELPEARIQVSADVRGPAEGERMGINGEFLRLALQSFTCEKVTLRFQTPLRPMLILGQTTADPRVLLMPVRLSGAQAPKPEQPKPEPKPKPVDDDASQAFQEKAEAYVKSLPAGRDKYAAKYVAYMIGSRKSVPLRGDLPPRQAFNTRSKLRALAQQATYVPAQGVADHEDEVR